jgi:hypothetical protein
MNESGFIWGKLVEGQKRIATATVTGVRVAGGVNIGASAGLSMPGGHCELLSTEQLRDV